MTHHTSHTDPADLTITQLQRILATARPVVVSMRAASRHTHLIGWARDHGLFVRVDRASDWGNPYVIGRHGNRDDVIHAHAEHLATRTDLLTRLHGGELAGKVLGCWCAPQRCHGDTLAALTVDPGLTAISALQARPHLA